MRDIVSSVDVRSYYISHLHMFQLRTIEEYDSYLARKFTRKTNTGTAAVEREVGILREQCRHETTDDSRVKELEVLIEQLQSAASSNTSSNSSERRTRRRRTRRSSQYDDEDESEGISGDSFRVLEAELDSLRREKKEQLLLKARETQRRLTSERELSSTWYSSIILSTRTFKHAPTQVRNKLFKNWKRNTLRQN